MKSVRGRTPCWRGMKARNQAPDFPGEHHGTDGPKREEQGMAATILDGKTLARTMEREIAQEVESLLESTGHPPGLATVLVGDDPASHRYVRSKHKACRRVGIESYEHTLPASTPQEELLGLIQRLNAAPAVHGILVQLPLPPHLKEETIVNAVLPVKDVDGFSPENLGLLAVGRPRYSACTPAGIQQLLIRNNIAVSGAHVVIVGRSQIVGRPLSLLLSNKGVGGDATVTLCHSRTRNIEELTRQADIVVVAIGKARFLKANMVRPGAVVVDVGMNALSTGGWVGDVDAEAVAPIASAITPVPGGVGPMTVTMLLYNTVQAARIQHTAETHSPVFEV